LSIFRKLSSHPNRTFKAGANNLEVSVVNLCPNWLILDGSIPENKRLTKSNINKFEAADVEKFLRMSGLIGPV